MKLIVGLGNPGKQYKNTRHNVGFLLLDEFAKSIPYDVNEWELSKKFNAQVCGFHVNGEKIVLAKPMTYMNHSGQSVGLIANFYKIQDRDIIVVHDDKDIPLGEYKIQSDRGHAGHNGIRSIIETLGTKNFARIRVGIASSNEKKMKSMGKFVLGKFGLFEKKDLGFVFKEVKEELYKLIGA